MAENRVESLDDQFAVAAGAIIAGIANKEVQREGDVKARGRNLGLGIEQVF